MIKFNQNVAKMINNDKLTAIGERKME